MVHWEATFHNLKCILGYYISSRYIKKYVPKYVYNSASHVYNSASHVYNSASHVYNSASDRTLLATSSSCTPRRHHPRTRHTNDTNHTKYDTTYY